MAAGQHISGEITLRPVADADDGFLFELYAASRRDDLSQLGWGPREQQMFLRMQFDTRSRAYAMQFPGAGTMLVLFAGRPAGQIIVDRTSAAISLTDIAIAPAFQRKGIARRLIRRLQAEAAASGVPLTLHVDKRNTAAITLYRGLGFAVTGGSAMDHEMRWAAPAPMPV